MNHITRDCRSELPPRNSSMDNHVKVCALVAGNSNDVKYASIMNARCTRDITNNLPHYEAVHDMHLFKIDLKNDNFAEAREKEVV